MPGQSTAVPGPLELVSIQAWSVLDRTNITAFVTYRTDTGPATMNIGAEILDYPLLELPTLGQVIWCLGDEMRESWRELSSPKQ